MRAVFAHCRRVLADDGTLWLNLGDSYYSGKGSPGPNAADQKQPARRGWVRSVDRPGQPWAAPKNLLGIPWRVAFALQGDGWILRNAAVWHKPNAMPESVKDRLTTTYEHVFLLTKSPRYSFNLDAIREPLAHPADRPQNSWARDTKEADVPGQSTRQHRSGRVFGKAAGKNLSPTGRQHRTRTPMADATPATCGPSPPSHSPRRTTP
jgi:DNA modification methylase